MSKSSIENVNIENLIVDINSQQPLRPGKVSRMVEDGFDINLAGTLIVSRREDGTMVILDGQHRCAAAIKSGIKVLRAEVFEGLTPDQESELFLGHNAKSNPTPVSKFRVAVNAGRDDENRINNILVRHGWRVQEGSSRNNKFSAVGAAYDIFNLRGMFSHSGLHASHGPILFSDTIHAITEAYDNVSSATHTVIVKSVAYFILTFWVEADLERLAKMMRGVKPEVLIQQIRANKNALGLKVEVAGAYTLANIYNERLRTSRLDKSILISG